MNSPVNTSAQPKTVGSGNVFGSERVDLAKLPIEQIKQPRAGQGSPQRVASNTSLEDPRANKVTVSGVTMTKLPTQGELATVSTVKRDLAPELAKLNPTIYVVDSFETLGVSVGSGSALKQISHGDWCASMIKAALPTVEVLKVEAADREGNLPFESTALAIDKVIAREAKLQGTSKPDLSRVFISLSVGQSGFTTVPFAELTAPLARFTQLGGTIYTSAGNETLNSNGGNPGVAVVYASAKGVGAAVSANEKPAQSLRGGTFSVGNGAVIKIPTNRLDDTSRAYVVGGMATNRFNPATGGIELLNAQGKWVQAVIPSRVEAAPVADMAAKGPLNGRRASAVVSAKDIQSFDAWKKTQIDNAVANIKIPPGSEQTMTTKNLSPSELSSLRTTLNTEFRSRFGAHSVISVANYKTLANMSSTSDRSVLFDKTLPVGLTPQTTYVAAEDVVLLRKAPDEGATHFYSRQPQGAMKSEKVYTSSTISTSAATPNAVVLAVKLRALQFAEAKQAGGPANAR